MNNKQICILMDPIAAINPQKDSTFAMMLSAQASCWEIFYTTADRLQIVDGIAVAEVLPITVFDRQKNFYTLGKPQLCKLGSFSAILIRTDPPFDQEYMYSCHILSLAQQQGALVANDPQALCNFNEKLFISRFSQFCAPTIVSKSKAAILEFLDQHQDIIVKPLDGMGGESIFRIKNNDPNTNVIIETIGNYQQRYTMAQRYISAIKSGDKRVLIVAGKVIPYALARVPLAGESRGNLAAGGKGVGQKLSARDLEIANAVAPFLLEQGILFAGIDIIGDYLTEINITSPTCIRELDAIFDLNIAQQLLNALESILNDKANTGQPPISTSQF